MLISGDFNLPNIPWDNIVSPTGVNVLSFIEALNDHFLSQLNNTPTRSNNVLDLVLQACLIMSAWPRYCRLKKLRFSRTTRHLLWVQRFYQSPNKDSKICLRLRERSSFEGLRSALSAINLSSNIGHEDINDDWQSWKDTFLAAVSDHIPYKRLKGRNPAPWIDGPILNLIKKKNSIRQKLKSSPTSHLREIFKNMRADVKRMLRVSREIFGSLESDFKSNPKRLWSLLKQKSKSDNIPDLVSMATSTDAAADQVVQSPRTSADNPATLIGV